MDKQWYVDQLSGDPEFDRWNGTAWMNLIGIVTAQGICCDSGSSAHAIDDEVQGLARTKLLGAIKYRRDLEHRNTADCRWLDLHACLARDLLSAITNKVPTDEKWFGDKLTELGLFDENGDKYSSPCPDVREPTPEEKKAIEEANAEAEKQDTAMFDSIKEKFKEKGIDIPPIDHPGWPHIQLDLAILQAASTGNMSPESMKYVDQEATKKVVMDFLEKGVLPPAIMKRIAAEGSFNSWYKIMGTWWHGNPG